MNYCDVTFDYNFINQLPWTMDESGSAPADSQHEILQNVGLAQILCHPIQ